MPLSPNGFPVLLTFDIDAETMWTARDPKNAERPIVMSQGAYGWKVGMPRILDLLARYGLHVTFFVPGLVMEQRPAMVDAILKGGHEIAHHSWSHAWIVNLTLEQEREEMDKGIDIITRMTGRKPVGYRSPAAEFSPHTLRMLREYGFGYSSNYFDDDSPYLHRIDGTLTDIVEFPVRVGAGRRAVLPVLDHAARADHAGPLRGVRGLAAGIRRPLPGRPVLLPCHASADHRSPVAHHAAGRADQVHPGALAGLGHPLRPGGRRAAAGAARGSARVILAGRRVLVTGAALVADVRSSSARRR